MMKTLDLDSRNLLKKLPYRVKTNTYVAYMLKHISLTVQILRKLLHAWMIQLNVSYLCPKLFYSLDYNY